MPEFVRLPEENRWQLITYIKSLSLAKVYSVLQKQRTVEELRVLYKGTHEAFQAFRDAMKKYSFILNFGSDPDMPDNWDEGDQWYKKRLLRDGGNYIDVLGVINPILHL